MLERVGLADVGRRPVRAYSMGMRQRLGLAAALLRQPRLLILDEPTNGLDPQGIHELRTLFVDLVHEGTTVFLSSHLLAEVELICTRAAMMANGRLVAQDRVADLLAPSGMIRIESPDASEAAAFLRSRHVAVEWMDQTHLRVHLNGQPSESINSLLVGQGLRIRELARERPTLEDVFLGLTGGAPAEPSAEPLPAPLAPPVGPALADARGAAVILVELSKLLRRPRTWVTITLLAGLPVVVGIFLKVTGIAPKPGSGPALLSEVLNNGVLFPAAALALILPVFLPVAVAVVAGDAIAGEASAGTLRYLLARPVSRSRLVTAKVVMSLVVHRAGRRHRGRRRAHRRGVALRDQAADLAVGHRADARGRRWPGRCWPSSTSAGRCSAWPASRSSPPPGPTHRSRRRSVPWPPS